MRIQLGNSIALALSALALNSSAAPPVSTGCFSLVGSMSQFRRVHTATLLTNGQVLVAGGTPFAEAATSEIYDPFTTTWTNSGPLTRGRAFHTATLLQDGRVVVTGGQTANQLLASTELYDPPSGRWIGAGVLNEACEAHTATLLNSGLVLIAGGFQNISSAEVFDPATGEWKMTGSMNTPRYQHTATLLPDGKVLVTGGLNATDFLASAELYDPITGAWTPTGSLQTSRGSHTATLLPNGKVLVAGGTDFFVTGNSTPTDPTRTSAEIYDPATGIWTPTGSMSLPRSVHTATLLPNGKVLVAGGFNSTDTGPTTELFDPASVVPTLTRLTQPTKLLTGGIRLTFRNTPGLNFTVLSTTDLAVPTTNWTPLGAAEELSPGHYHFTDSTTESPQRFYGLASP